MATTMKEIYGAARNFATYVDGWKKGLNMSKKVAFEAANEALRTADEVIPGEVLSHVLDIAEAVVHGQSLVDYLANPASLRYRLDHEYRALCLG